MKITLTEIAELPVYDPDGTQHNEPFATLAVTKDDGESYAAFRVLLADLNTHTGAAPLAGDELQLVQVEPIE